MRRWWSVLALATLILATSTAGQGAGVLRLPVVRHEGRSYVELERVAASIHTRADAPPAGARAYLRVSGHTVTLTRNWTRVVVDDRPVVLDAPVRVRKGVWLVPDSFLERVVPRLTTVQGVPAPVIIPAGAVPVHAQAVEAALEELRFRSYPSFTRVVLETSAPVSYRVEAKGERDARVRLGALAGNARTLEIRDGFVQEVRLERARGDALLRVTFDGTPGEVRATTFADPDRLVLDFMRPLDPTDRDQRATTTPLRVMVIDAGHGGHDPGATGPTGLMEKELVLDVTKRVAKLAGDQLGIKVLLSRDADHFVTLRDRTSFANKQRADVFVSIHANAHREVASEGVETYFLSSEATDNGARQVAALENSVVQLEKPAAKGRGVDIVKTILWDLAQSEFQEESSRLAEIVQDSMSHSLRIPSRGVKQAGFYVLGGAAMPAILIEIGFVTNPKEEKKLRESRYRDDIARAIAAGLREYKRAWDQRLRQIMGRPR
ncbi:MAG TPA: N-acetylmuramoyl-L-alanine amidase [Candidatus Acidoferrum sp.]|nr:N-acetylmuramoyl-L-alanine amidase [Candidatus Acidoferrum sp.]